MTMKKAFVPFSFVTLLIPLLLHLPARGEPSVSATFDEDGLSELHVENVRGGTSILKQADVHVNRVQLASEYRNKNEIHEIPYEKQTSDGPYSGREPSYSKGATDPTATTFDPEANRLTKQFNWGRVGVAYRTNGNRLTLDVRVRNESEKAIAFLSLNPLLKLQLSGPVKGGGAHHNVGAPTVLPVSHKDGTLVVTNDRVKKPLRLKANTGKESVKIALRNGFPSGGKEIYDGVWLTRPIAPGNTDTYRISLRFGNKKASKISLGMPVYKKYRKAYPRTLEWRDRRPVGNLFISGKSHKSKRNPYGWNFVSKDTDLRTEKGKKKFKEGLMKLADRAIGQMHQKGLQGMIVWDLEAATRGEPHYFGSPRYLPVLAPLMHEHVDAFFRKLREAGLHVGITIRPKLHWPVDKNDKRVDEWNSEEQVDTRPRPSLSPEAVSHPQFERIGIKKEEARSPFHRLDNKIAYAKKRWNCKIFYIDTVYLWRPRNRSKENKGWASKQLSAEVFRKLNKRHPDVLLIPEQQYPRYWAYTAPYHQIGYSPWSTKDDIRAIYPEGFVVQNMSDTADKVKKNLDTFIDIVTAGDTFLTHGWWGGQKEAVRKTFQGAAERAPYTVDLKKNGAIVLNGTRMDDPSALQDELAAEVDGKPLKKRRTVLYYQNGTPAERRKNVIRAIEKADAILAWSDQKK